MNIHKFDPVTAFLDRSAWAAWLVLTVSIALGFGHDLDNGGVSRPGAGSVLLDVALCISMSAATVAQFTTQVFYPNIGGTYERIGRWLSFFAMFSFSFRMVWVLAHDGDLLLTPLVLFACYALSIAQMFHCAGVISRASGYKDGLGV
jgi:hypothetical protein